MRLLRTASVLSLVLLAAAASEAAKKKKAAGDTTAKKKPARGTHQPAAGTCKKKQATGTGAATGHATRHRDRASHNKDRASHDREWGTSVTTAGWGAPINQPAGQMTSTHRRTCTTASTKQPSQAGATTKNQPAGSGSATTQPSATGGTSRRSTRDGDGDQPADAVGSTDQPTTGSGTPTTQPRSRHHRHVVYGTVVRVHHGEHGHGSITVKERGTGRGTTAHHAEHTFAVSRDTKFEVVVPGGKGESHKEPTNLGHVHKGRLVAVVPGEHHAARRVAVFGRSHGAKQTVAKR